MAELFRSQVRLYGKHGLYAEALSPDFSAAKDVTLPEIKRQKYLFNRIIDVYMLAPMIGYLYQREAQRDGSESTKSIMGETLSAEYNKLIFTYQLIMILDRKSEPDLNERIRRAFSSDEKIQQAGLSIFNSYARGGIEVLYEELIEGASTPDDLIRNTIDFIENFNERLSSSFELTEADLMIK